jgi:hypothetical protein
MKKNQKYVFWFRKQGEGGLKIMLDYVWEQAGSDFAREDYYSYLIFCLCHVRWYTFSMVQIYVIFNGFTLLWQCVKSSIVNAY